MTNDFEVTMERWIEKHLPRLVSDLSPCRNCPVANTEKAANLPGQSAVVAESWRPSVKLWNSSARVRK